MYTNCIFDLYGTLVDIHTDENQAALWEKLAMFYGYYGAAYMPSELKAAYEAQTKATIDGQQAAIAHEAFPEIRLEQVFLTLFEQRGVQADMPLAIHAGQFFRILSTEYVRLYDGTLEMLKSLKAAGKKVYLLSNAQRIFTEHEMKALNIYSLFDDVFISSDFGCKKPDPRFFSALIRQHELSLTDSIMIGNDGTCDIAGAKGAGLHTLYIHSNLSPEEDLPDADFVLDAMDMGAVKKILLGGKV